MSYKRVLIIANKNWEATALTNVLLEAKACPDKFPWPARLTHPLPPQIEPTTSKPKPRAVFHFQERSHGETQDVQVEVWCIQDAMNPSVSSSSTKEKDEVLGVMYFGGKVEVGTDKDPDFVVAFGTAGFPGETSYNGCVFVGANTFIHDPFSGDVKNGDYWHSEQTGQLIKPSPLSAELFSPDHGIFDESLKSQVESRFLAPPMNPARKQILTTASNYTAVGVVNITNYDDYAWADEEALHAFKDVCEEHQERPPIGSVETTHGVIHLQSETPFIFISGITDRIGHFNMEVGPRPYAQNFACAHNAGVVAAWLIPRIVHYLNIEG
jgi:hypothetical protein